MSLKPLVTGALAIAALTVAAPASAQQPADQFTKTVIDVASLAIPGDVPAKDVDLTWAGQVSPTYITCATNDTTANDEVMLTVTVGCWSVQEQDITATVSRAGQSVSATLHYAPPAPYGSRRDFRLLPHPGTQPYRFQPCVRIPVRINPGKAPANPDLMFATRFAVDQVAAGSGLRLEFAGTTKYMPRRDNSPPSRGIWLGYAYPGNGAGRSTLLTRGDSQLGIGGPFWRNRTIESGQVALHRKNIDRYGGTPLLIQTLMHEIAHAVGLDHSSRNGGQLMAPVSTGELNVTWGKGDLTGLRKVGPGRAC